MRTTSSLPAIALVLLLATACSETTVTETIVIERDASDASSADVETPERDDAFSRVVAGITEKGSGAAEAAWADRRPTLLLFAASS